MKGRRNLLRRWLFGALLTVSLVTAASGDDRIPLTELGDRLYLTHPGGLYPDGRNEPPADHAAAGLRKASLIVPRDRTGRADPGGKIVFLSIGMSNTTQEFCSQSGAPPCSAWSFTAIARAHPRVDRERLVIVNGALGGQNAATWQDPRDANYSRIENQVLPANGVSPLQVQAAWVKLANARPTESLPVQSADAYRLKNDLANTVRAMKVRYPNLQIVYLSSRIFAGYATTNLNPEPFAYESAWSVKYLIESQILQIRRGFIEDTRVGDLNYDTLAPWLSWGPYLWANGALPRADGLVWLPGDFEADGTHPATSGETKAAKLLLDFLLRTPTASRWFASPESPAPPRRRLVQRP